jgi:isopentenyl phosphate kinase
MTELVVIKFGGGLITDKGILCTAKPDVISGLCEAVSDIIDLGFRVIVVHGAGSYGHLKAKAWSLAQGRMKPGWTPQDTLGLSSQDEAVQSVRSDMDLLNSIVVDGLTSSGIDTFSVRPRDWATGTGPNFSGDISIFSHGDGRVAVSFGDVVNVGGELDFGILSGDDIVYRVALELDADHVLFAMGGAPGLMSSPPHESDSELVRTWSQGDSLNGQHESEIDVTGGIELKLDRAASIAEEVANVWLIDGEQPGRLVAAVQGLSPIGTRILATTH